MDEIHDLLTSTGGGGTRGSNLTASPTAPVLEGAGLRAVDEKEKPLDIRNFVKEMEAEKEKSRKEEAGEETKEVKKKVQINDMTAKDLLLARQISMIDFLKLHKKIEKDGENRIKHIRKTFSDSINVGISKRISEINNSVVISKDEKQLNELNIYRESVDGINIDTPEDQAELIGKHLESRNYEKGYIKGEILRVHKEGNLKREAERILSDMKEILVKNEKEIDDRKRVYLEKSRNAYTESVKKYKESLSGEDGASLNFSEEEKRRLPTYLNRNVDGKNTQFQKDLTKFLKDPKHTLLIYKLMDKLNKNKQSN